MRSGEWEQNPHICYDKANSLINSRAEHSFASCAQMAMAPTTHLPLPWLELEGGSVGRSVRKERRTVVPGAQSRRTEKRQREIKEESFFMVWWFHQSPQQSPSVASHAQHFIPLNSAQTEASHCHLSQLLSAFPLIISLRKRDGEVSGTKAEAAMMKSPDAVFL